MSFEYTAPIPGTQVRKDFLIGNRLMRVIWGFKNRDAEVEFTAYLAQDTELNRPDLPAEAAENDAPFAFEVDGRTIPFPGSVSSIVSVASKAPAREVEIVLNADGVGKIVLACWIAPDSRIVYFDISAPDSGEALLRCGRVKENSALFSADGDGLDPSSPIPATAGRNWQFCLSWADSFEWTPRESVIEDCERDSGNRTSISMNNAVLAERANTIASTLEVSRRVDGRLPAGAHHAYSGSWIRDGVMDCIGMMYAGLPDMGNTLLYLLKNVPPKEGQLEEYGMMVFGLYHYYVASGDRELLQQSMAYLKSFVHDVLKEDLVDPDTGLLASTTEGYWERNWLGKACEVSQNAWAVLAARLYTRLGKELGWDDDYEALNSRADDIWARSVTEKGFVRDGRFVKRLFPGGEHQVKGPARRGLSMGNNPYRDQFASARDHEEIMEDLDPDVQTSVPWLWGLLDPNEDVCKQTAAEIWKLWNQDWDFGGLERYSVFSDCDRETAGPWFLASMMAARAFSLQDDYDKVSQIIGWTDREFLGSGWSERISRAHPVDDPERYVHQLLNWPGGEYLMLIYREGAGLYPTVDGLVVRPHLVPDFGGLVISNFKYRDAVYQIRYHGTGGNLQKIEFNGRVLDGNVLPVENGEVDVYL